MQFARAFSGILRWFLLALIIVQFFVLLYKDISMLTLWAFIEYCQLISFLPLMRSRYVPWLYEIYRPFLFSHLIFSNDVLTEEKMETQTYRSFSYQVYSLSDQQLLQSIRYIGVIFFIILVLQVLAICMSTFVG